jgi:hypothetical protein
MEPDRAQSDQRLTYNELYHNRDDTLNHHYRENLDSYCMLWQRYWYGLLGAFFFIVLSGCLNRTLTTHDSMSDTWDCTVDTRPSDTIVRLVPRIVSSRHFVGAVHPMMAERWLAENQPILEVWSPDKQRWRRSIAIPLDGRIVPVDLPPGRYCFRASAVGFVSAVGRIQIERSALDTPLDLRLPLAN